VPNRYKCPLFIWKTGKPLANVLGSLTDKWEVRSQRTGDEMVELRISAEAGAIPLTLNLNVISGQAIWGYIDLPVLQEQEELLKEVTERLKTVAGATIGPLKRRVKFKFQGESIETETTTAEVYSWVINYGLRYDITQLTRFFTALDSSIRQRGGRPLEGNEFFVTYKDGALQLRDENISFVLVTSTGYYSAFLHIGETALELQICDEEDTPFPEEELDGIIKDAVAFFESEDEILLPDSS
jgi:hypothetical protein